VNAHIYIEGGESKEDQILCRKGFRKLLEKAGFSGKMPRLTACGARNCAFDDFKTAHAKRKANAYIAMLIDSEEPVNDIEKTWAHLKLRDNWNKPSGPKDEQVLFMTTCMETWIVADRAALKNHYGHKLQENALPPTPTIALEQRGRHAVQDKLVHATRNCKNAYAKGKRSFEILAELDPVVLVKHLPSYKRVVRILRAKLV
jgi:hypothetical protein